MGDQVSAEYRDSLRRLGGAQKIRTAFGHCWEARKLQFYREGESEST